MRKYFLRFVKSLFLNRFAYLMIASGLVILPIFGRSIDSIRLQDDNIRLANIEKYREYFEKGLTADKAGQLYTTLYYYKKAEKALKMQIM